VDLRITTLRPGSGPPRAEPPQTVSDSDAGRFLVFALLLFALATWILIMAWMSRHAYYPGQYPFPSGPGHP
jgi:hypothetical protein